MARKDSLHTIPSEAHVFATDTILLVVIRRVVSSGLSTGRSGHILTTLLTQSGSLLAAALYSGEKAHLGDVTVLTPRCPCRRYTTSPPPPRPPPQPLNVCKLKSGRYTCDTHRINTMQFIYALTLLYYEITVLRENVSYIQVFFSSKICTRIYIILLRKCWQA